MLKSAHIHTLHSEALIFNCRNKKKNLFLSGGGLKVVNGYSEHSPITRQRSNEMICGSSIQPVELKRHVTRRGVTQKDSLSASTVERALERSLC